MSDMRKIEYTIIPDESFSVIKNCSGCGCKTTFHNTNCFRVNANGNRIDIWLIYQCIKCKHTYNLTVYERCRPESIVQQEYEKYLSNSSELAFTYGTDSQFFAKNKAKIDWKNIKYNIKRQMSIMTEKKPNFDIGDLIVIRNSYGLKIRTDKIICEILHLTRSRLKELEKLGSILVSEVKQEQRIEIKMNEQKEVDSFSQFN